MISGGGQGHRYLRKYVIKIWPKPSKSNQIYYRALIVITFLGAEDNVVFILKLFTFRQNSLAAPEYSKVQKNFHHQHHIIIIIITIIYN